MAIHCFATKRASPSGTHRVQVDIGVRTSTDATVEKPNVAWLVIDMGKYNAMSAGEKAEFDSSSVTLAALRGITNYETKTDIT